MVQLVAMEQLKMKSVRNFFLKGTTLKPLCPFWEILTQLEYLLAFMSSDTRSVDAGVLIPIEFSANTRKMYSALSFNFSNVC